MPQATPKVRMAKERMRDAPKVGVYLRIRPMEVGEPTMTRIDDQHVKTLPLDGSNQQVYSFTKVFEDAPQSEIFEKVARPITEEFIQKPNDGLIFTYGITGSGKTYTMEGRKKDPGLIYRTIDFTFNSIGSQQTQKCLIESDGQNFYKLSEHLYPKLRHTKTYPATPSIVRFNQGRTKEPSSVSVDPSTYFCLFISLVELYNKYVYDLFEEFDTKERKGKLEIRTDRYEKTYVANVCEIEVKSAEEAVNYYKQGIKNRKTSSTELNQDSSRGHCVLNLRLVQVRKYPHSDSFDENTLRVSQLCLVDLAGSERAKRSGATGGALHEAGNINNSLAALRKCIRLLREQHTVKPADFRGCSLTRLFTSYFKGFGLVRMILCVKPTVADFQENNIAMGFGLLTQDVAIDYASPPKRAREDYNYVSSALDRKMMDPNADLTDKEFFSYWISKMESNAKKRERMTELLFDKMKLFRQSLVKSLDSYDLLRRLNRVNRDKLNLLKLEPNNYEALMKMVKTTAPSAPAMEPLQTSSPIHFPSTTDTAESNTAPTTTNSSTEAMDYHEHRVQESPARIGLSPIGIPVANPRYNRSLSCSDKWIHHTPPNTVDTGTVLRPKVRNGQNVKELERRHVEKGNPTGYSVVHQETDTNGEIATSVYKASIAPTVCGGAQVIFNDVEVLKQESPKRKRAASDTHFAR